MDIQALKLVYFSPTGTTKKIIEKIAQGINHRSVEVIDITQPEKRKQQIQTSKDELLILGVPVYFGRIQSDALAWLQTLKANHTPTVCVVVYGNRAYDDALRELRDIAAANGCVPIAGAAYIGEHSFSNTETPIAVNRPDDDDLRHAQIFGERIKNKLLSLTAPKQIPNLTVPGNYPYKDKKTPPPDEFIGVSDHCSQCGLCAEVCPVNAIDAANTALINPQKCIRCCACIKNCPAHARFIKNVNFKTIAQQLSQTFQDRKEPVIFL